jgi:putative component of toxin-antitoxin plasmid stabilization module
VPESSTASALQSSATYLLLVGGDKKSQKRDIKRALEMAQSLKE